jgi:hypothetical protein
MQEQLDEPYPNVFVTYHPFPYWLERFDKNNTRTFKVNVASYRFQRERHKNQVTERLDEIAGKRTGQAKRVKKI